MMAEAESESTGKLGSKRIFVNHVDCYHGKNIGKYLSNCIVGASLEEREDEEEDDLSFKSDVIGLPKEGTYRIIGSLKNPNKPKPAWVHEIINFPEKEQMLEHLAECDVVVYDINEDENQIDEASWAASALHAELERFETPKTFILISTIMTWGKSKPVDPDDPEIPFTEEDYRRRKPHSNFKAHISAEKLVVKLGKTNKAKFVTYVVASGLTYGGGENIFHYLFKAAWHGEVEALQCFGNGMNVLPTIHIKDLAGVIQNIADSRPKTRYLLAVDDSQNSLEEIVKSVSSNLGNGKVKHSTKEDSLLNKGLSQQDFDMLLTNLRMDGVYTKENMNIHWVSERGIIENIAQIIQEFKATRGLLQQDFDMLLTNLRMDGVYTKENMNIHWVSERGIIENIAQIIQEFKATRGLLPMRGCVLGPPAVGKTTVVAALCKHYKLHHIKIKDVIDDAIDLLERSAARADADENEDDDGKAQEDQELLESIMESKESNNGRIEDQYILRFYRDKLHSMPCQNQGFMLDGFPKTVEQAKDLFAADDEEEHDESSKVPVYDKNTMPEVVISLDAPDDFLKRRVMNLPESTVAGTHNNEEGLIRRLTEFRGVNEEDTTVLNYFDELEIHPEHIDVTKEADSNNTTIVEQIIKRMGEPRNYGPTPEEVEEMERIETEKRLKNKQDEREEHERQEAEESALRTQKEKEWIERLEEVKRQETEQLENQSIPLRNYLMKHVMPSLTQGLIECCKVRPDDAIDYLAEYLFRNNPQVD